MLRFGPRFFRYCLIGWKQKDIHSYMTQIIGIFLVFEVLVRQKDRLLLNFSYFLSNEIYFGRIFTVGNRNRSLKILFLDNVNILECENNIPLKSCSDIIKEKKNE